MLQADEPDDYVIATGETHRVREFLERGRSSTLGLDWEPHVEIDPRYFRPAEVDVLLGDASQGARAARLGADGRLRGAGADHGRRRRRGARGPARRQGHSLQSRGDVSAARSPDFWQGKRGRRHRRRRLPRHAPSCAMLEELGADVRVPRSAEHDLRDRRRPRARRSSGAEVVIHLAARVGGIGFNRRNPAPLAYDNLMMGAQRVRAVRAWPASSKLVAACSVCAYPKFTPVPFREDDLWNGYPEESNAPYGLAKKMLLVLSDAYRRQYGFDSCVPVIANLYGPDDNFDLEDSHVIAAMIRKYVEAASAATSEVVLWGTGKPTREFLYVDDAARALLLAAERYDSSEPVNIGTGPRDHDPRAGRDDRGGDRLRGRDRLGHEPPRRPAAARARRLTRRARVRLPRRDPLEDGIRRTVEYYREHLAATRLTPSVAERHRV